MLPNDGWLCLFVWCKACHHQAPVDLRAIIDGGRGDVPVKDLKFRCTKCRSSPAGSVVMARTRLRCSHGSMKRGRGRIRLYRHTGAMDQGGGEKDRHLRGLSIKS
jgi:hypothetical protein